MRLFCYFLVTPIRLDFTCYLLAISESCYYFVTPMLLFWDTYDTFLLPPLWLLCYVLIAQQPLVILNSYLHAVYIIDWIALCCEYSNAGSKQEPTIVQRRSTTKHHKQAQQLAGKLLLNGQVALRLPSCLLPTDEHALDKREGDRATGSVQKRNSTIQRRKQDIV